MQTLQTTPAVVDDSFKCMRWEECVLKYQESSQDFQLHFPEFINKSSNHPVFLDVDLKEISVLCRYFFLLKSD